MIYYDLFICCKLNYEGWCSSLLFWQALDIVDIVSTTFCRLKGETLKPHVKGLEALKIN